MLQLIMSILFASSMKNQANVVLEALQNYRKADRFQPRHPFQVRREFGSNVLVIPEINVFIGLGSHSSVCQYPVERIPYLPTDSFKPSMWTRLGSRCGVPAVDVIARENIF